MKLSHHPAPTLAVAAAAATAADAELLAVALHDTSCRCLNHGGTYATCRQVARGQYTAWAHQVADQLAEAAPTVPAARMGGGAR